MRYKVIQAGLEFLGLVQADRLLSKFGLAGLKQGCGLILTLHRVRPAQPKAFAPNQFLEITPEFLDHSLTFLTQSGFEPLSLDHLSERMAQDGPHHRSKGRKPFFIVTFDDGFLDVLVHAWPILRKHRCPWAVYITSDYAQGQGHLWWLELEEAVERNSVINLKLGSRQLAMRTHSRTQKHQAYLRLRNLFYATPAEDWPDMLAELSQQAAGPSLLLSSSLCANWEELEALAADENVTIGSHTLSHPILSRISNDQARFEIAASKTVISHTLGRKIRHFSYPSGGPTSFTARDVELVRQSGYQTAVTTRPAHLWARNGSQEAQLQSMLTLPRISLNGHFQTDRWLRAIVSGLPFKRP